MRDSEIEKSNHPVAVDHDICGFHVSVDDAGTMRVIEARADLLDVVEALCERQRLLCGDDLVERFPVDILHGHERLVVLLADFVNGDEILVTQVCCGPGFAHEPFEQFVIEESIAENLYGNQSVERRVASEVNGPHAAAAQPPDHLVLVETIVWRCWHLRVVLKTVPIIAPASCGLWRQLEASHALARNRRSRTQWALRLSSGAPAIKISTDSGRMDPSLGSTNLPRDTIAP
jgi:hypothetical protein